MTTPPYDVILIGYGPVAEVMAVMLGRQGRRVAVFERWTERYPLPRAVCIDHEMFRMLSAIGMRDALPAVSHPAPPYRWLNAEWKELLTIDWSRESISGGAEVNFIHQPTLEAMFDEQVHRQLTVEVHLGFEAVEVSQAADLAHLVVEHRETRTRSQYSARYLIGCDGANSLVRNTIGGGREDRGFEADWLVLDILPHEGVELDIPQAAQWCNPERPTTIVPAGVRDGRKFRRWEFMRLPHETIAQIENEEAAWALLAPWVRPDQATLVRHKVYTFRSLLAERWRDRRLLIAGDAAHVMPPFMGQGMCAGLRDDFNLAWKLEMVLDGTADPKLLDTYQQERQPHVSDVINLSMYLGQIICQPDPEKASERDAAFFAGIAPPPPAFPHLTAGLLYHKDGQMAEPAGELSPHGMIRKEGVEGRFDDLVGAGVFVLIADDTEMLDGLSTMAHKAITSLHVTALALAGEHDDLRIISDLDGKYLNFLHTHGCRAILVRPDFYVFGGAADATELNELVMALAFALPGQPHTIETVVA